MVSPVSYSGLSSNNPLDSKTGLRKIAYLRYVIFVRCHLQHKCSSISKLSLMANQKSIFRKKIQKFHKF